MTYANREPLASAPRSVSTKPIASANAAWSSAGAGVGVADGAHHVAVVLAAVGHVGVGRVRHRERERAHRGLGRGELRLPRGELVLQRAGRGDLRRALVGRGLADLLRRRVLPGAQRLDLVSSARRASSAASTSSIRPSRTRLRSMPRGTPGSSRSRLRSITGSVVPDLVAQLVDPTVGVAPRLAWPRSGARGPSSPPTGYEPRNFTSPPSPRACAGVGHDLVGDVALAVDEEAVVAEALLGRPRLELGEVDRARRELLEDPEQRARAVRALEAHDRRLVVAGRAGTPRPTSTKRVWFSGWSSMSGASTSSP